MKFYELNVAISLSDGTPNCELLGMHKSPVNPKCPPNISAPRIEPHQKIFTNLIRPGLVFGIFRHIIIKQTIYNAEEEEFTVNDIRQVFSIWGVS